MKKATETARQKSRVAELRAREAMIDPGLEPEANKAASEAMQALEEEERAKAAYETAKSDLSEAKETYNQAERAAIEKSRTAERISKKTPSSTEPKAVAIDGTEAGLEVPKVDNIANPSGYVEVTDTRVDSHVNPENRIATTIKTNINSWWVSPAISIPLITGGVLVGVGTLGLILQDSKPNSTPSSSPKITYTTQKFSTIPKKYKHSSLSSYNFTTLGQYLINDKNLINKQVRAYGMNSLITTNNYTELYYCNQKLLNKEASSISIYDGAIETEMYDDSCMKNRGLFYYTNDGNMHIKTISSQNDYDSVIDDKPLNTFVYDEVLVTNGSKVNSGSATTDHIALCQTSVGSTVFYPKKNLTLNEYSDILVENQCINGVLLTGNIAGEHLGNAQITIKYGNNTTYDSLLYFEE